MWMPPAVVPTWAARDPWARHLVARLAFSLAAAAAVIALPELPQAIAEWTGAGCLLRAVSGWPCPGCGITTSLLALASADVGASIRANPAGPGVAAFLAGQAIVAAAALARGAAAGAGRRWLRALDWLAIAGLTGTWLARLAGVSS